MVYISDIILVLGVALIYLLIIPFQLVIFPMNYFSVREVIYHKSTKKAIGALASRFMFILIICIVLWLSNKSAYTAVWGVSIGSFLCTWPSIYHYQLFLIWKNKSILLYFCSCIASVFFSFVCAKLSMDLLLPILFEGKSFYFLDNSGFSIILSILGFCAPFGIRTLLDREDQLNPYVDSDTFLADLCLTKCKIKFENYFEYQYHYEIDRSAKKYHLSCDLLTTILQLERINRGSWHVQFIESVAVKFFKSILIKKNATLGLAQIDIRTAHGYFQKAPALFLSEMIKPHISIDLCAYKIRSILDEYVEGAEYELYEEDYEYILKNKRLNENEKIGLYIASQYTCGNNLSLRKFALVYATIISENNPKNYL